MSAELSLWSLFSQATIVVKIIMLGLVALSVTSWAYIIQRWSYYKKLNQLEYQFSVKFNKFKNKNNLKSLVDSYSVETDSAFDDSSTGNLDGYSKIFLLGTRELTGANQRNNPQIIIENSRRSMDAAILDQIDKLEQNLSFLATVGSVSPYIGLFGTAWGIMHSFIALGSVQQATLSMVAPGIAEALIATAMGLFAAIPASIAYNRYANYVNKAVNKYEKFQIELTNLISKQIYG